MQKKLWTLCALLLILALMLTGCTPAQKIVEPDSTQEPAGEIDMDGEKALEIQQEFRTEIKDGDYSITEGLDDDIINILLLGTDNAGAMNSGRTDAMIICSVNVKNGEVKLSSIVRDLYVQMPNKKSYDRINAANSYGGPNMAIKCVNEVFGLNISRYISVNFEAFAALVDMVGGVEIDITNSEAREISQHTGIPTKGGVQLLNGKQALHYCRIRVLDNNFGRNERQRKFLSAMVKKVLENNNMEQLTELTQEAMRYVATNLSGSDVMTLLFNVVPNMGELQMYSCPGEGEFRYKDVNGASVVEGNDKMAPALHAFIYGEE